MDMGESMSSCSPRKGVGAPCQNWTDIYGLRYRCSTVELKRQKISERDTRIELASLPWEGSILPVY